MSDADVLERVVAALHEAMLDDARWPETSRLIDEAVGARGGTVTFGDEPSPGRIDLYFARSYYRGADRSEWLREYLRDYHADDEHMPRLRALPDGKVAGVRELFTDAELRTSRTYNELLARVDGRDGLNVRLDGPRGSRIVWGIADPVDADGWSSPRVAMVRRILPHVRQYVRVRSALVDAGALGRSLGELLSVAGAALIELDGRGRVVAANDRARDLLRAGDGLTDRGGVLRAAAPGDAAGLARVLARALTRFGTPPASGSTVVRRVARRTKLAVHVKPVANRELDHRPRRVAAVVLVAEPAERGPPDPGLVAAALGLSPVETEVAVLVARGLNAREIATATGRAHSTVRTHLKHIFTKLDVSRQFEVAQAVQALSSVPPESAG